MPSVDPQDLPEEEGYSLLYPFTVVTSKGGPYDDDAFTAGFACGLLDKALTVVHAAGGTSYQVTIRTDLVQQAELVGMARNFPIATAQPDGAFPEWTLMTFQTEPF